MVTQSVWKKVLTSGNVTPTDLVGSAGTNGYVLKTNGSSTLSWVARGDIEGIGTEAGSGLTGGASSGTPSLALDEQAGNITLAGEDDKIMVYDANESEWGTTTPHAIAPIQTVQADDSGSYDGIKVTTLNQVRKVGVDITQCTAVTSQTGSDGIMIMDDSDSDKTKGILFEDIKLSTMSNDAGFTTNTGDITQVVAGTGLSGGASSGSATLTLDGTQLGSHTFGDGTGTITINGNLTVSGTTTTVDSTVVTMKDNALELNSDSGNAHVGSSDVGLVAKGTNNRVWGYDQSTDRWGVWGSISTTALSSHYGFGVSVEIDTSNPSNGNDNGTGKGSLWLNENTDTLFVRVGDSDPA